MRRAGAANMVLCTSIQTIDEHETDTYGGGVHTQMSREAWPIQIAIIGAVGQISDALQAFSGTCCAAMDRPCRCAAFSDAESFAASARREEYDVVFCGAGGDEALALLRGAAPRAGMILVSRDVSDAVRGYAVEASGFLSVPGEREAFAHAFGRACRRAEEEDRLGFFIREGDGYRRVRARELRPV